MVGCHRGAWKLVTAPGAKLLMGWIKLISGLPGSVSRRSASGGPAQSDQTRRARRPARATPTLWCLWCTWIFSLPTQTSNRISCLDSHPQLLNPPMLISKVCLDRHPSRPDPPTNVQLSIALTTTTTSAPAANRPTTFACLPFHTPLYPGRVFPTSQLDLSKVYTRPYRLINSEH